ncbi:hypothetical protein EKH55_0103 [Sinorhizobium alkalisoli]|nr:hypothetical protein EKH55_0103 [Sinorhizobium alkalisoli]
MPIVRASDYELLHVSVLPMLAPVRRVRRYSAARLIRRAKVAVAL